MNNLVLRGPRISKDDYEKIEAHTQGQQQGRSMGKLKPRLRGSRKQIEDVRRTRRKNFPRGDIINAMFRLRVEWVRSGAAALHQRQYIEDIMIKYAVTKETAEEIAKYRAAAQRRLPG